jgi:hypothetical protein
VRTPNPKSLRPLGILLEGSAGTAGTVFCLCSSGFDFVAVTGGIETCFFSFSSPCFALFLENIETCVGIFEALERVADGEMIDVLFAVLIGCPADSSSFSFCLLGLEPWKRREAIIAPRSLHWYCEMYYVTWSATKHSKDRKTRKACKTIAAQSVSKRQYHLRTEATHQRGIIDRCTEHTSMFGLRKAKRTSKQCRLGQRGTERKGGVMQFTGRWV